MNAVAVTAAAVGSVWALAAIAAVVSLVRHADKAEWGEDMRPQFSNAN